MKHRATRLLALTAVGVAAVGLTAGCSGGKKAPVSSSSSLTSSSAAVSTTPVVKPTTKAPVPTPSVAAVNPLTGVGAPGNQPVIAVKIDDTAPGRPQVAIDQADIVYIEQAEGGLSRLIGVFGTHKPVVGYVRSTRPSDPELLLQYGKITLVASGGGGDSLPLLDQSGLTGWINDRASGAFARVDRAASSYINLTIDLAQVAAKVKSGTPKPMGFTWSSGLGRTVRTGARTSVNTLVGSTPVSFRWNPATKKYVRYIDGVAQVAADGNPVATPNVIVQYCTITPHPGDVDVNGNPAQFTSTIGSGKVVVFRNGIAVKGTWSRKNAGSGTVLRDAKGTPIPLAPGGAWVALVGNGAPLTSS